MVPFFKKFSLKIINVIIMKLRVLRNFLVQCEGGEWFHYTCVGLTPETRFKGKWFCPTCRQLM